MTAADAHALYTAAWLRACCQRLPQPSPAVAGGGVAAAAGECVGAAVLIPLIDHPDGLTVLLTQRTQHLRDHAGQISFPGGRCEAADADAQATALRESREEVGIEPQQVDILAVLPDYLTGTGYCVTPLVGLVKPPLDLRLDPFEVAEVFETPLVFFLDEANFRREKLQFKGELRQYWAATWQGRFIWGATAAILHDLRRALLQET